MVERVCRETRPLFTLSSHTKQETTEMRRININHILLVCVAALTILCVLSVWQPIHFDEQKSLRERDVKAYLLKIKKAEEAYLKRHGAYTKDFAVLVKGKYLADSLQYIPHSNGKRFKLVTSILTSKSGRKIPLMECSASYADYLEGLNEEAIQAITDQATGAGRFPGLKIGDLTTDNDNAGNW